MDQNTKNLLYGVYGKNIALLVLVYICIAIMGGCLFTLVKLAHASMLTIGLVSLVGILLFCYNTWLIVRNLKHSKELKEKYNKLTSKEQEEVNDIAKKYDGSGLKMSEHFLYGFMARVTNFKKARDVIVFEYIPFSQIAFIDTLKNKEQEEKEKDFKKYVQTALFSANVAYRRSRTGIGTPYNPTAYVNGNQRASNYICIELKDGSKYRAFGDTSILEEITSR